MMAAARHALSRKLLAYTSEDHEQRKQRPGTQPAFSFLGGTLDHGMVLLTFREALQLTLSEASSTTYPKTCLTDVLGVCLCN